MSSCRKPRRTEFLIRAARPFAFHLKAARPVARTAPETKTQSRSARPGVSTCAHGILGSTNNSAGTGSSIGWGRAGWAPSIWPKILISNARSPSRFPTSVNTTAPTRRRFLEEARTAATLDHPYLCPVYDAGEIDGQPYLTMAYIDGQSLAALIGDEGWPQRQVAALVGKLALALQEAHTQKVIHRDLKPANVMIKTTGQRREPVIVDFGLARRDIPQEERLTRVGQVMGTLGYMAPEQIRGDLTAIGPATDIYALGVILYELLTGRLPFNDSGLAVAAQILTEAPLPPSTHRTNLDPALEAIVMKAMAKSVGDRYSSMAELAAALTGFLQTPSATATPTASIGLPASSSITEERPQPARSSSLVAHFLAHLAGERSSPAAVPASGLAASRCPRPNVAGGLGPRS